MANVANKQMICNVLLRTFGTKKIDFLGMAITSQS